MGRTRDRFIYPAFSGVLETGLSGQNEKSAAVFAVRRANYTHRRKGVFNGKSIEDLAFHWQCARLRYGDGQLFLNRYQKLSNKW
jgi:hypothetical protein